MADEPIDPPTHSATSILKSKPKRVHKKLQPLPANAKVHKRPLLHTPIPSPYTNAQQQKVIYVSTKAPFLSIVKRAEKLLRLSEKRLVQSATTLVKQNHGKRKQRPGPKRPGGEGDEILEVAQTIEAQKNKKRNIDGELDSGEEIVLKGTGKAIQKVLELALWFQQREEYVVRLRTGSVGAIDDITVDEGDGDEERDEGVGEASHRQAGADAEGEDAMEVDTTMQPKDGDTNVVMQKAPVIRNESRGDVSSEEPVPETRIRYTSVLEVALSLR